MRYPRIAPFPGKIRGRSADSNRAISISFCSPSIHFEYVVRNMSTLCEVLPDNASAGKDMGIWNVSMVLPQIVGPAATGWTLSWMKTLAGLGPAYVMSFAVAAVWLVLAASLVSRIKLPHAAHIQ